MTIQSGFFNSVNGDRKYSATNFAEYFASFIGNGVFPNPSSGLQVVESENMNVVVKAGKGWINGYFVVNDSDYTLTLDNADGVLKRVDSVVMRLNYLTREIEIVVKKGTFASNPVAPSTQRDADYHELVLADVFINNGAVQIAQANITDTRLNAELCGIVHGLIDQVDTTSIFNQYQAWFNSVKDGTEQEIEDWQRLRFQEFEAWFNDLQVILDGDVAANLTGRIASLEGRFTTHLDDDALIKHKAQQISVVNPETQTTQDMQTFAETLFTNVSNGKDLIGTAITDVDRSIIVPSNPTFPQLADAINSISTGKKWASGIVSIPTSGGTTTVSGFDFSPNYILVKIVRAGIVFIAGIFNPNGDNYAEGYWGGYNSNWPERVTFSKSTGVLTINSISTNSGTAEWIAFE